MQAFSETAERLSADGQSLSGTSTAANFTVPLNLTPGQGHCAPPPPPSAAASQAIHAGERDSRRSTQYRSSPSSQTRGSSRQCLTRR